MDPEQDEFMELNADDEKARRILSLALEFMNAKRAIGSTRIARDIYPGLSPDSFRKAFQRDRKSLCDIGIMIEGEQGPGEEDRWFADIEASFAQGANLDVKDALVMDIACQPILGDPEFPLRDELRFALAKIDTAFGDMAYPANPRILQDDRVVPVLRSCARACHAAHMTYTDAAGKQSERLVAPYGFYGMRGSLYMVAPSIDDGSVVEGSIRVYNVSRVDAVSEDPETIFSVPKDFSVGDYRRLPFQFGPTTCVAAFEAPACSVQELEGLTLGRGRLVVGKNAVVWTVDVSDVGDAASWAIASGIRPTAPRELVDEWRKRLEKVSAHVC